MTLNAKTINAEDHSDNPNVKGVKGIHLFIAEEGDMSVIMTEDKPHIYFKEGDVVYINKKYVLRRVTNEDKV